MRRLSILFCVCITSAVAQAPRVAAFEVASIHVHPSDGRGKIGFYSTTGGRVELGICNLAMLVGYAFDVDSQRISGIPDWATKVSYDINALPAEDSPSRKLNLSGYTATPTSEQREMILRLLVERFGLKYHFEQQEMPVYLLERGKGPLKLVSPEHPERKADPRGGLIMRGELATGEGFGQGVSMSFLAKQLMWPLERPVLDRTGLDGIYDFRVEPVEPENQDRLRAAQLLTQNIGLRLIAGRAPVRVVRIDAATPPAED